MQCGDCRCNVAFHSHVVAAYYVQPKSVAHNTLVFRKDPLVALLQDQVHCLIEAFQASLQCCIVFVNTSDDQVGLCTIIQLTMIFLPSLVITLTVST